MLAAVSLLIKFAVLTGLWVSGGLEWLIPGPAADAAIAVPPTEADTVPPTEADTAVRVALLPTVPPTVPPTEADTAGVALTLASPMVSLPEPGTGQGTSPAVVALHPDFFDPISFQAALDAAGRPHPSGNVCGIVVPHHLLAAELIGRGYGLAAAASSIRCGSAGSAVGVSPRSVKLVAIVGPNHRNVGGARLTTVEAAWRMPDGGGVTVDSTAVEALAAAFGSTVKIDADAFSREHSVGVQVPFVQRFFPGAAILPIIIDSNTDQATAERLGRWLGEYLRQNGGLAVFSIDFSHYLTEAQATIHDAETRRLVEDGGPEALAAISRLTNDNVDSPGSLIAALAYAQAAEGGDGGSGPSATGAGGGHLEIIANTNANDFLSLPVSSTTSHFLMVVR